MEILKPNELKEKFDDPWVAPYQKVLTMVDGDKVEIVEYHPLHLRIPLVIESIQEQLRANRFSLS
jgi:hypothetical protein